MKISNNHYAFLTSAVCGFLVWYFSEEITGNSEPWNGNVLLYAIALTAIGFLCVYLFGSNLRSVYWGGFLGQAALGAGAFLVACSSAFFAREERTYFRWESFSCWFILCLYFSEHGRQLQFAVAES